LERVTEVTAALHDAVAKSDDFVAVNEPQFNIFCFRYVPFEESEANAAAIDAINAEVRKRLNESGEAWITSTIVNGRRVLRVTIINPRTSAEDVLRMLDAARRIGREVSAAETK
jgi:L-2,4-diaminobutyrate decarboxylase